MCKVLHTKIIGISIHDDFTFYFTIKGGYCRKVLMMMKAAKLGWAGPRVGQEQTMSRVGAG